MRQVIVYLGFSEEYIVHKTVYTPNNTKPRTGPFQVLIPLHSWKGGNEGNQRFLCARGGYKLVDRVTENRGHNVVSKLVDDAVNQALAITEFGRPGKDSLMMATSFESNSKKPERIVAGSNLMNNDEKTAELDLSNSGCGIAETLMLMACQKVT